jgi:membrane protein implicated in regulation of membrane protease activity
VALVWVVVAAALVLFELHHLAFFAIFGGIGAAAAALVALGAPDAYAAQGGTAVAVAIVGVWFARPYVSAVYERRHQAAHVAKGVHGGLIGHEAVTLDEVGGPGTSSGHVRFVGERWLARSADRAIEAGARVRITAVEGTTLVVAPLGDQEV